MKERDEEVPVLVSPDDEDDAEGEHSIVLITTPLSLAPEFDCEDSKERMNALPINSKILHYQLQEGRKSVETPGLYQMPRA